MPGRVDFVSDYVRSEVMSSMPPEDVDFLLDTAVLQEVSAPLCDAVRARAGSGRVLERLADRNAFIIRHWYQGRECWQPIAKTGFPKDFDIFGTHRLVVVVEGDTVWATVDGQEVFRVPSLQQAVAGSPCRWPLPEGTRIGFRTWSTTSAVFEGTTLS